MVIFKTTGLPVALGSASHRVRAVALDPDDVPEAYDYDLYRWAGDLLGVSWRQVVACTAMFKPQPLQFSSATLSFTVDFGELVVACLNEPGQIFELHTSKYVPGKPTRVPLGLPVDQYIVNAITGQ